MNLVYIQKTPKEMDLSVKAAILHQGEETDIPFNRPGSRWFGFRRGDIMKAARARDLRLRPRQKGDVDDSRRAVEQLYVRLE